jgi:hypothetical protein
MQARWRAAVFFSAVRRRLFGAASGSTHNSLYQKKGKNINIAQMRDKAELRSNFKSFILTVRCTLF